MLTIRFALTRSVILSALVFPGCTASDEPGDTGSDAGITASDAGSQESPNAASDGDASTHIEEPDAASPADEAPHACDPLSIETEPATLGHVIAVGQDANGTFYVASSVDSGGQVDRIFVSEAGVLSRKRVSGSGSSGGANSGDEDDTVSYEDGAIPARLVFKKRAGAIVGMALVHDDGRSFFDALPSDASQLKVVDASQIQKLPLKNLPAEVVVEIVASAPDGDQLVLTRPNDDWSYEDFRIYYGHDGKLIERKITFVGRGSSTYVTFSVDGADYNAIFANAFLSPNTPSTLRGKSSSGPEPLTLASGTLSLPEGATFECLPDSVRARKRPL